MKPHKLEVFTITIILALSSSYPKSKLQVEAIKLQPEGSRKHYWSGEKFVITCQNNNNIKNVKMRWIGPNGNEITDAKNQRVRAESSGPHGHRLTVMNATAVVDDGKYRCTLGSTGDQNPKENAEFELKVVKATSFGNTPRQLVLSAGKQATLECEVEFDSNVTEGNVSWHYNKRPIEDLMDPSYKVVPYDHSRQVAKLIIDPVKKHHDGVYTCEADTITSHLSKIFDHDIQVEIYYKPTFERDDQIVWVERTQSIANRRNQQHQPTQQQASNLYGSGSSSSSSSRRSQQFQNPRSSHGNKMSQAALHEHQSGGGWQKQERNEQAETALSGDQNNMGLPQVTRVELRCNCQANPSPSIIWSSSENSNYALEKGSPAHILEQPTTIVDGHNTTSILVVGYNLTSNWRHKQDKYICSASNKVGTSTTSFTIKQGDPPPAFKVAEQKQYNPQNYSFLFTILGPDFDSTATTSQQQQSTNSYGQPAAEVVPAVDSFRIRADISYNHVKSPQWPNKNLNNIEPNTVHWNAHSTNFPQNVTINLGKLPSGRQKLYLEAHNAVGWSLNATDLGDYNIVSGALSLLVLPLSSYLLLLASFLISSKMCYLQQHSLKV